MRTLTQDFADALPEDLTMGFLIEAAFASETIHIWTGVGDLEALDETWKGTGPFIELSTMSEGAGIRADGIEARLLFKIPGAVPIELPGDIAALALDEVVQGAPVTIYWALFTHNADGSWALIDDPAIWFKGLMDIPSLQGIPGDPMFTLTLENRMASFKKARGGTYSPEEQKRRFPGDLGLDFMPELANGQSGLGRGFDVSFGGGGEIEQGPTGKYKDVAPFDGGPIAPIGPQGGLTPIGPGGGGF